MRRTQRRWRVVKWATLVVGLVLLNWPMGWALLASSQQFQIRYVKGSEASVIGWPARVPSDWPVPSTIIEDAGFGASSVFAGFPDQDELSKPDHPTLRTVWRTQVGWPCRAIEWTSINDSGNRVIPNTILRRSGYSIRWHGISGGLTAEQGPPGRIYHVPVRPIPLGLAINTTCALALAIGLRFTVCRLFGPRPHQCPSCRYDLRGLSSSVCPECGSPISPKPSANASPSNSATSAVH